jgi:hypothetical protein
LGEAVPLLGLLAGAAVVVAELAAGVGVGAIGAKDRGTDAVERATAR